MQRLLLILLSLAAISSAADLRVAVAANFRQAFEDLLAIYPADAKPTYGSSGLLFAQIRNGAPFDLFLSADTERPRRLVEDGYAIAETVVVYARGRLVLVGSSAPSHQWFSGKRIALANPLLAPYGRAADQVLSHFDAKPQRITATNVSQAFHFSQSGAVDGGFVALSQVRQLGEDNHDFWIVPADIYTPIEQELVVIKGPQSDNARALASFILSDQAQALIRGAGYL